MKTLFSTVCIIAGLFSMNAQSIGVRAGADFATAKADFDGIKISDNETGFYIGLFTEIQVSESLDIRPEINYIAIQDLDQIQVPVLAQFGLSDKFNVAVGPSFGFLLNTEEGEKSFNFGAALGLSFDISENFLIEGRYTLGLSNLVEDNEFDASLKLSGFQLGLGYKF
ncbi:Outer membrane protein beta-barrel domain-containing protein [Muriicola jejuensis]|uniref:Outer membrane beta-barrel protein n=1 Tax=Muriicola jejuensis TaxID=504488 RepID=A0A6P0UA48_9FLAO|nr:porin family protein [Muriicola jejuensis]NER09442.1 outer membrane beta-barrel protein [Muriicola jejuensis]SMP08628.1 Outer membrane protein beta-barrel domain-containing protein [Muriicola jejuensis]